MKAKVYIFFFLFFISCGQTDVKEKNLVVEQTQPKETIEVIQDTLINFTLEDVARFTMSSVMGQPPKTIKVNKVDEQYFVSYKRESDNKKFDYKVKMDKDIAVWAPIDGRWRNSKDDETIRFKEIDNTLRITQIFSDGSNSINSFKKGD